MLNDESAAVEIGTIQGEKFYDILAKTRAITIAGEINQKTVDKIIHQLLFLQELADDPIKVFINSQGGHVESGDTIHDFFKFVRPRIIVIGTGWVASAAITIYLGAEKKDRYSLPNTRYLIHQPAGGIYGQAADINIEANELIKMRDRVTRIISEATGQPLEKVANDTDRNFWMSAPEAKEYGIVSNIITTLSELR